MKKTLKLCLVFIVASEECFDSCISKDEVQLLQVGSHDRQASMPGLHSSEDSVGETQQDAGETAKLGAGLMTYRFTDALGKADFQLKSVKEKFSSSVSKFYASAKMVDSVAQNLTKLQKLVSDTVEDLIPCYQAVLENVDGAVEDVRKVLLPAGHEDTLELLEDWEAVAIRGFTELADTAEEMGRNVKNSASINVREAVDIIASKTQQAVDISQNLRAQLNERMAVFANSLVPKLSLTLGGEELDAAVEKTQGLDRKADRVFGDLETLLTLINSALPRCGEKVDYQQYVVDVAKKKGQKGQKGFLGHLWRNAWTIWTDRKSVV